jgi:cytochrome c
MIRIAVASLAVCLSMFAAGSVRAEGDAAQGEKLFRQCKSCHATEAGKNRVGPSLFGVVGRKAGSAEEFKGYSEGLKAAGFSWDDAKLDAYLTNPKAVIADSKMAFAGIAEAADREHVVAYLKTLK